MLKSEQEVDRLLTAIVSDIMYGTAIPGRVMPTIGLCEMVEEAEGPEVLQKLIAAHPTYSEDSLNPNDAKALIRTFHRFNGYCHAVPEIGGYVAKMKYDLDSVRFSNFGAHYVFPHEALIVILDVNDVLLPFLIDPTFRQYSELDEGWGVDPTESPGNRLNALNAQMYNDLITKGFHPLTRESAEDYVQSLKMDDPDYTPQPEAIDRMFSGTIYEPD